VEFGRGRTGRHGNEHRALVRLPGPWAFGLSPYLSIAAVHSSTCFSVIAPRGWTRASS
jgi:hypothetical protein